MFARISAFFLLLILSPLLFWVWVILSFSSESGAIFKQERIGYKKQLFIIYKFTTMHNGEITKIGKYLRKTGIDELPQFINILKGEMNFIGPRPLTSFDIKRLNWDSEEKTPRWNVKPGISGLAQLSTVCTAEHSIKNDLYYVQNKSVLLDLKIIFQSILIPIIGKPKILINE